MASALLGVKQAVVDACEALFPSALVTFGHPGYAAGLPDDIVSVLGARSDVDDAPVLRPAARRATDEMVTVEVVISAFRGSTQLDATTAASSALDALVDYCATSATTSLGGACLWSHVSGWELLETEDPDDMAQGRVAEITVTIIAKCRR